MFDDVGCGKGIVVVFLVMWFVLGFVFFFVIEMKFYYYIFFVVLGVVMLMGVFFDRMFVGISGFEFK